MYLLAVFTNTLVPSFSKGKAIMDIYLIYFLCDMDVDHFLKNLMLEGLLELKSPPCLQSSDPIVDLEGRSQLDTQAQQDVLPLHHQHGAPVNLLQELRVKLVFSEEKNLPR